MIDWKLSEQLYGNTKPGYRKRVAVTCDNQCGTQSSLVITRVADVVDGQLSWICPECSNLKERRAQATKEAMAAPEVRARVVEASTAKWRNDDYRTKVLTKRKPNRKLLSDKSAANWQDPEYRARTVTGMNTPENLGRLSVSTTKLWQDHAYRGRDAAYRATDEYFIKTSASSMLTWSDQERRKLMAATIRELWADPEHRARQMAIMTSDEYRAKMRALWESPEFAEKMAAVRAAQPRVSSIQTALYSMLDDLGVSYHREYPDQPADTECVIGPYCFDCVVPRENKPVLLIECQGGFWHYQPRAIRNDKSKSAYITSHFPGQYELKEIWEHEFDNYGKVVELLKYWLGITRIEAADFDFSQVTIKPCPAAEYRQLLTKYHYLSNAGRGGIAFGAYLDDTLAAVCVFSPLSRQNIATGDVPANQTRELSRLCIHPRYQKKNFASWFVSRCIKSLPEQYRLIISYCDVTFNHDGAVYKACNFVQDRTVPPDYWYVDSSGWAMHKKTLYNRASLMHLTESEFANRYDYRKVYGREKLRFVYRRD